MARQLDPVAEALIAVADGDTGCAIETLDAADDELAARLRSHLLLRDTASTDVYVSPAGFEAFIEHGSNPALYGATSTALSEVHSDIDPRSVVDVGCGDGRVTHAAIRPDLDDLHLVEPSRELLDRALERPDWATAPTAHCCTLERFLAGLVPGDRFDLVQSTFALHTIEPDARRRQLAALRRHADHLAIVDFDVPDFDDRGVDHARYAAARYRDAIAEYRDHPIAISDFLMPVLVAQFDPGASRMTFEQSAERWRDDLDRAGFRSTIVPLFDFWWAPAFLLTAT